MPHCKECGAKIVEDMMLCGSCGAEVTEGSTKRFCRDCGLEISPTRYERYHGYCGPCTRAVRGKISGLFCCGSLPIIIAVVYTLIVTWFVLEVQRHWFFGGAFAWMILSPWLLLIALILIGVGLPISVYFLIRWRRRRKSYPGFYTRHKE